MKKILQFILRRLHFRNVDRISKVDILRIIKTNDIVVNKKINGENLYLDKWKVFGREVDVLFYRGYATYIGHDENIVPTNILNSVIEPVLNDKRYSSYYNDKNVYGKLFPKKFLPATFLRKMYGCYYDEDYNPISVADLSDESLMLRINGKEKIIIKPTINTNSGVGVMLFTKCDSGLYKSQFGDVLSMEKLNILYEEDFIIQEYLYQHEFTSQFNSSSVNTYRITTYRSVRNNEVKVLGVVLRIGKSGSPIDNIHAGGYVVGIDERGILNGYLTNADGHRLNTWNGIDYSKCQFGTPHHQLVIDFAKEIATRIIHQRFLALDIMIDGSGTPKLIEFNIGAYSEWIYELNTGTVFGRYTDEVISYCQGQQNNLKYCFYY